MRFDQAIQQALTKMEGTLSKSSMPTWKSHARRLIQYFGPDFELADLKPQRVQEWINWMKGKSKPSTVRHYFCMLKKAWEEQEEETPDVTSPWKKVKLPKRNEEKRQCRPEAFEAMRAALDAADQDLIDFAVDELLRRAEVFRLTAADFTFETRNGQHVGEVRIRISKTGVGRTVKLTERAAAIAKRRIAAAKTAGHTYLFGDQGEDRVQAGVRWCRARWYKLAKKLGVKAHFHGLRHLGARTYWQQGKPIEAISSMLGHSTIAQTQHYLSITAEAQWSVVLALVPSSPAQPPPATPQAPPKLPEHKPDPTAGWGQAAWEYVKAS